MFCRGAGTVAGLNFTGSVDANGYRTLGYTWNNEAPTFGWDSQIAPVPGQWSFVALTITPSNATVSIFDANGLRASSLAHAHVVQSFSTNTWLGADPFAASRQFDGQMDAVGIYNQALSQGQLEALYSAAKPGASPFGIIIWSQPASQTLYAQQTASFSVGASGTQPVSYQWQWFDGANYFNIPNGGRISGATSPTLTLSNLVVSDATDFLS